jgi:hypothetical protein
LLFLNLLIKLDYFAVSHSASKVRLSMFTILAEIAFINN